MSSIPHATPKKAMERDKPEPIAYSIRDACHASSLSRSSIYSHIKANRLRANRIGGRTVIPADSLRALLAGEAA